MTAKLTAVNAYYFKTLGGSIAAVPWRKIIEGQDLPPTDLVKAIQRLLPARVSVS
jgi:hypothetical protein